MMFDFHLETVDCNLIFRVIQQYPKKRKLYTKFKKRFGNGKESEIGLIESCSPHTLQK